MFKKPEIGERRTRRGAGGVRANADVCPALVTLHHSLCRLPLLEKLPDQTKHPALNYPA